MNPNSKVRIIVSGGGTGGHIFPAISIADEIKRRFPDAQILFVGAIGRMEMERVPDAGYEIIGLPVSGFQRKLTLKNLKVLFDLFRSIVKAKKVVRTFKPQLAIGVGGYASGPVLRSASRRKTPTLLQEQNSYAGVTNKLLAKRANKICVAYSGMDRFFPSEKIILTGNPVRNIQLSDKLKDEAFKYFGLDSNLPVVLAIGGSLGARTINEALLKNVHILLQEKIQVIWQTGKYYFNDLQQKLTEENPLLKLLPFIARMDLAYNVADVMISRAGAISISEICLTGKASVLVPSPNVAEDHQTKNAMALVDKQAAIMVKDKDALQKLVSTVQDLLMNEEQRKLIAGNSKKLGKPNATNLIVDEVEKLLGLENDESGKH